MRGWVFVGFRFMADPTASVLEIIKSAAQLKFELKRSFYSGVCSGIELGLGTDADDAVLQLAAWSQFPKTPKLRALTFYRYYRDGRAKDVPVSMRELFADDPALFAKLKVKIAQVLRGPVVARGGEVPVPQREFASDNRAQDWRMSVGSFNLRWKTLSVDTPSSRAIIEVWFTNVYKWHPNEPRVSQCVHQAAERLKVKGARDFLIVSDRFTVEVAYGENRR